MSRSLRWILAILRGEQVRDRDTDIHVHFHLPEGGLHIHVSELTKEQLAGLKRRGQRAARRAEAVATAIEKLDSETT